MKTFRTIDVPVSCSGLAPTEVSSQSVPKKFRWFREGVPVEVAYERDDSGVPFKVHLYPVMSIECATHTLRPVLGRGLGADGQSLEIHEHPYVG